MSYWKSKVAPKLKKLFDNKGGKKKGAANACKLFDSSKESLEKEIEEKTTDLSPKVVEIYRSSTVISKSLLKEPSESAIKENPDAAQTLLQELTTAEFPGALTLSDAGKKYGPALLTGPVVYLFGKTSTFLVDEPSPELPQETRDITIQSTGKDKAEEQEALPDVPHPAPASHVEEESGALSEEKKGVTPFLEAKKDDLIAVVEDKKEVTHSEANEAEVAPLEAKKEEEGPSQGGKKEEVKSALERKKEAVKGALGTDEKIETIT